MYFSAKSWFCKIYICPIVYCLYRLALSPQGRTVEDVHVITGFILVVPGIMTPNDFLLVLL